jgi:hypothetical protein
MTEDELREWKHWLQAEGKQARSISTPRSIPNASHEASHRMIMIKKDIIKREKRP